nr:hypothetical protein [Corynebacterium lactis]
MQRRVLDQVWTPTQHIALWLGAWLSGFEGYDHTTEAIASLGGPSPQPGSLVLADAVVPDVVDVDKPLGCADMMRLLRAATDGGDWREDSRALVRLVLSGPGDAPLLPAGTEATRATAAAGGAIVVADAEPGFNHVLVAGEDAWLWYTLEGHLPEPAYLSPGEADLQLADASRRAAEAIAAMPRGHVSSTSARRVDPHLLVGMLDDHLDMAFVPDSVPRRALGVLARADRVSSILAVAQGSESGVGGSAFDPQLIPLWRLIRQARMSAVDYAVREWTR